MPVTEEPDHICHALGQRDARVALGIENLERASPSQFGPAVPDSLAPGGCCHRSGE
jgi:hypothetical protein